MAYIKPTEKMVQAGVECGWTKEESERGYLILDFDGTELLEINRIDCVYEETDDSRYNDVTDEDCAREAERSGYCKIIPVDELPENMVYENNNLRYFGWVDTPENRENIRKFFEDQN